MKRNIIKSITAICALLLLGAVPSLGFNNHFLHEEVKEAKADYEPFITFSTSRVVGKAGEISSNVTATLNGYQGTITDVYSGIVAGGSEFAKINSENLSNFTLTFNIELKKAGVTRANVMFVNNDSVIAEDTIDVYVESGGDYTISRFASIGYHSLYFADKGYLEFTAPSGYSKVTNATTNNGRCVIDSVTKGDGDTYKINFTTHDYVVDKLYDDEEPGVCMLTIYSENESDNEQTTETLIYLYINDFEYDSPLFIAWDFASDVMASCARTKDWMYIKDYYFAGYDYGNAAIEIINNVRYEMPDRNTVIKLNDNNVPYTIVHGISQYDYMVGVLGCTPHNSINRDTSAAGVSLSTEVKIANGYNNSNNAIIVISIISLSFIGVVTFYLLKRKKN